MPKKVLQPAAKKAHRYLKPAVVLPVVWMLGFLVRIIYLLQLKHSPLFDVLMGDAKGYDTWAREIAAGDWLGKTVFYQAPLYPYFLGTWYAIAGTNLWALRLVQLALGATSCVFLAAAGYRLFSPKVGAVAGLCLAFYPSAIFFDGLVQKTVLDNFFITLLLLWMSIVTLRPARLIIWLLVGITLACLALSRENALVLPVIILGWLFVFFRNDPWRRRLPWAGMLILGMALILLPVVWRNHHVGGGFQLTTSQFGTNLYIGNNPKANGTYVPLRAGHGNVVYERSDAIEIAQEKTGKTLTAAEVSSYWTNQAFAYIQEHPLEWLGLTGRKFMLTWNAYEISDTDDQYLAARWSPLLRILTAIFHFGVICPIAAIGIVFWQDRRRVWLLYLILAGYTFSVVLFYVLARYRYPLVPVLLLFTAAGLLEVFNFARKREYLLLISAALVAGIVGVFANQQTGLQNDLGATALYNLGVAKLKLGQLSDAADYSKQALQLNPNHWGAHNTLGRVLAAQKNHAAAAQEFQYALSQAPQSAELHNNLGDSYVAMRRLAEAATEFQEAIRIDPTYAEPHNGLGVAFVGLGRLNEAGAEFHRALELKPDWPDAKRNYNLYLQLQQQAGKTQ